MPAILPTGTTVTGFAAQATAEGVAFTWETTSEANIAGFRVLRQAEGGELVAVSQEMIFAEHAGSNQGAGYSFTVPGLQPGAYLLEIVKLDGSTDQVGPVEVQG